MLLREMLAGKGLLLLDGATGTQLAERGHTPGGDQNLLHPEAVRAVHESYLAAGSGAVTTNTLTDNRIFLESHGLDSDIVAVNRAGASLARAAAQSRGTGVFVLGDIGSTGQLLEPYGDFTEAQLVTAFAEQARILGAAGVDGFLIETIMDLREAACAVRGCREASPLPVLVTMSFQTLRDGGRTAMGSQAADCGRTLSREGADAVGSNCGDLDPNETAEIISRLSQSCGLPLIAQPNAGKPRLVDGEARFDMEPERFADGVALCIERGARLVGGCCGTTPAHIAALARRIIAASSAKGRK
jgi:5-methyltetrahydrofolate--homocysteine methyltransferase